MVSLFDFTKVYVSGSNVDKFKDKIGQVTNYRVQEIQGAKKLVLEITLEDEDQTVVYLRLNTPTLRKLIAQGFENAEDLIGQRVRIISGEITIQGKPVKIAGIEVIKEETEKDENRNTKTRKQNK